MRTIRIGALGGVIDVELGAEVDPDLENQLANVWLGAARSAASGDADATVRVGIPDDDSALDASDPRRLASELSSAVTMAAIGAARGRGLLLHAAGLAAEDGRVVVFVAPSGGGKSTLTSSLGRHFGYVSDETVLVEPSLAVHHYRKPLSMVEPGRSVKRQIGPAELGLGELPTEPLTLAGLVLLDRRQDAPVRHALTDVPLAEGVLELAQQLSFAASDSLSLKWLVETAVAVGGIRRLTYRNDTDLREAMREVLASSHPVEHAWELDERQAHASLAPETWVRHEEASALWDGERLLVWTPGTIHDVGNTALMIWTALGNGPLVVEQLAGIVEEQIGPPPTGTTAEAIRPVLLELAAAGILVWGGTA